MKLGFVSSILDFANFEEVIDIAANMGYQCVEIACWPTKKSQLFFLCNNFECNLLHWYQEYQYLYDLLLHIYVLIFHLARHYSICRRT